jgi:hypothetical protein
MGRTILSGALVLAFTVLAGCYKTVGPVVASVRFDDFGALHYTECNLVVGSVFGFPRADLEQCQNENGDWVQAPKRLGLPPNMSFQ